MRIAFVTDKPYKASETFIKAQIDHLPFPIVQYYGHNFPLLKDGSEGLKIIRLVKFVINKLSRRKNRMNKTIKQFKKDGIELVLAQYGPVGSKLVDISKELNLPLIVHFHGYDASRKSVLSAYKDSYKKMFSYASKIISVSNVMTSKLIELGCPKGKIIYNVNAPEDLFIAVEPKFTQRQIIAVGRFVEKKAPHLVIESFKKVLERFPEMKLIFAGEGDLLAHCQELVIELGIKENVEFPGVISPDTLRKYLSESLIFVQHSITAQDGDMEGTPVAILEASGAGLPVVSTKHAGIPDIIIDGETGFLVEEKDTNDMAEKIIFLLQNPKLAQKMGSQGKKNIKENFSFQRHLQGLTTILNSAFHK